MNCLPLVVYLMLLLDAVHSVLGTLPVPVNVSVHSVNFNHVLLWNPGHGTPPGTQYMIRRNCGEKKKYLKKTTMTSFKLKLNTYKKYCLTVQASYNQTLSPVSSSVIFTPFTDTKIGPPKLSLAGCGNCIQINITLPKANKTSRDFDVHNFYKPQYRVFWRKPKDAVEHSETGNTSFTIENLENWTEYCVQVETKIRVNKNTVPSTWNCVFTSIAPNRAPVLLGTIAAVQIFVFGGLMIFVYCLYSTGFLCKLKALPRQLIADLSQGHTLTPEKTICDRISISSQTERQRTRNNPTTPQAATRGDNLEEDEEDDEEEGEEVYMDRGAELSSGDSSCQDCSEVSGNRTLAASGDSGCLTAEAEALAAEFEVADGGLDKDEAEAAEVSFIPEGGQTGVQGHVTDEEEDALVCDSSGNVDLFSVTLSALVVCEEEEQNTRDSLTDFLKLSDTELLLPTNSKRTLSHTDSQTESGDGTTVAFMLPTQEDLTATVCEGRRADTLSGCRKSCDGETQHEETQEEEEEFSGYMSHK